MFRFSTHMIVGLAAVVLMAGSAVANLPPHDETNGIACEDCHALAKSYLFSDNQEQEALCRTCHNPTGLASARSDVALHSIHSGSSTVACTGCHDQHGSQTTADPHPGGQTAPNLKLIRGNTSLYVPAALEPAIFQLDPNHFAFSQSNPPWSGVCQTCHTQTRHHTNNASADHEHNIGSACITCHQHKNGFAPVEASCTGCHSRPQGLRRQIVGAEGDFGKLSSHVGGMGSDEDCVTCHEMSQHQQGEVRLKNFDTGGVWTRGRDQWCLSCHDGDPPAGVSFPAAKGTGYDKSGAAHSTHWQNMGTSSCSHCHHVHGSSHRSLLKGSYRVTDFRLASESGAGYDMCWTCHDQAALLSGGNAFYRFHSSHVNRADVPCFACHDTHSAAEADEPGLIDLDHAVRQGYDLRYLAGYDSKSAFSRASGQGHCYITCHGLPHDMLTYAANEPRIRPLASCLPCHAPNGKFVHEGQSSYCSDCHWDDRPAAPHPGTKDCSYCHHNPGASWKGAVWDHTPIPNSCELCHEDNRPSSPHPPSGDCSDCHTAPGRTWSAYSWNHASISGGCSSCHADTRPSSPHPQTGDCSNCHTDPGGTWAAVNWNHQPTPSSCSPCHEGKRPASPHPQTGDCSNCHTNPGGSWSAVNWNHQPTPSSCSPCHEGKRPASPHPQTGDCSNCHTNPGGSWSAVNWNHQPTPATCAQCHEGDKPSSHHPQTGDCSNCHHDPGGKWD